MAAMLAGCGREEGEAEAVAAPAPSEPTLAAGGAFIEEADLDHAIAKELVDPDLKSAEEFIASIKVPFVEFSRSNLANALIKIQEAAAEHSISHQSFSVIVTLFDARDATVSPGNEAGSFGFESDNDDSRPAFLTEETFSGVYRDVPITTLLDEICRHFSVWYQITPYAVEIRPSSVPKPDYRIASFPFDRNFALVENGNPRSVVTALEQNGMVFDSETNAYYDEANSRLIVKGDKREIELIAQLLLSLAADEKD
jgi:hypothetical protein